MHLQYFVAARAVFKGSTWLLTVCSRVIKECLTPLHLQYLVTTRAVLKRNTWLLQDGSSPLHLAAKGGHVEAVSKLLSSRARADATDNVSLHD
jgi:hypothetical protein